MQSDLTNAPTIATTQAISETAALIESLRDKPFEIALVLESRLRSVIRRVCGKHRVDDAWSDVVLERITRIVELYDPVKGSLQAHVVTNVRWYVYKWAHTDVAAKQNKSVRSLDSVRETSVVDKQDTKLELDLLFSKMHDFDVWILRTHVIEGFTLDQVAVTLGCSLNTAKNKYRAAMERARKLVSSGDTESN